MQKKERMFKYKIKNSISRQCSNTRKELNRVFCKKKISTCDMRIEIKEEKYNIKVMHVKD